MPPCRCGLNATGAPGEIAARAGHSVRRLQDIYTHCIDGREDFIGQQIEGVLDPDSGTRHVVGLIARVSNLYSFHTMWGGWGSNPRPADNEKHGPMHRTFYLH
jgi:hypothetical protein